VLRSCGAFGHFCMNDSRYIESNQPIGYAISDRNLWQEIHGRTGWQSICGPLTDWIIRWRWNLWRAMIAGVASLNLWFQKFRPFSPIDSAYPLYLHDNRLVSRIKFKTE
jgi:hypothetical protein